MASRPNNVQIAWIAGTVTTALFLASFVPITLKRAAEGQHYRSELAAEAIGRLLALHLGGAVYGAPGPWRGEVRWPDGSPAAVRLLDRGDTAARLVALQDRVAAAPPGPAQTLTVSVQGADVGFHVLTRPDRGEIVELDAAAFQDGLVRVVSDNLIDVSFALGGGDAISVQNPNAEHRHSWYDVEFYAAPVLESPGLGRLSLSYHEHRPLLPIETVLVLILAAVGMSATYIGSRVIRGQDEAQARTEHRLSATEERLSVAEEISGQAQKLDAVGKLTGGMAHDFNNLLTVILGNIELAREMTDDAAVLDCLDMVESATYRGADLTKNMLAFARRATLKPEVLDLNAVVREAQAWMTRALPESIVFEVAPGDSLWPVFADRSALETALLNLLLNARDAMGGQGRLTVETANTIVDAGAGDALEVPAGRYVTLAVGDDGQGIQPEDLGMIFDPFFTTKTVGQGTGLGLSMVQGFVKQSGGTVSVRSEPGRGTCLVLYFPVTELDPKAAEADPSQTLAPTARARILLVEDEAPVRDVLARALRGSGYVVTEAATGDAGLRTYGTGGAFDVVVTDIVMPGTLQGPAMARQIRTFDPRARVVFMTGYASEALVQLDGIQSGDIRLSKPVRKDDLMQAIERTLAEGQA